MTIPDTNTFSLQDVVDEVNPTSDDLVDCISDANSSNFDTNYYTAPATSLLEFRNYSNLVIWSPGNITEEETIDISNLISGGSNPAAVQPYITQNGLRAYIPVYGDKRIRQLTISSSHDLNSTVSLQGIGPQLSYFFTSIQISDDGLRMIVLDFNSDQIKEYSLTTAWNIATMSTTPTTTIQISTSGSSSNLAFNFDGTKMWVLRRDGSTSYIEEWNLSSGWDLSTITTTSSNDITSSLNSSPTSIFYTENGSDEILIVSGGYGGDSYINGITNSDHDQYNVSWTFQFFNSASTKNFVYSLNRSGSTPNYSWNLKQWNTNTQ